MRPTEDPIINPGKKSPPGTNTPFVMQKKIYHIRKNMKIETKESSCYP